MSTPCSQSLRPNRLVVSEYEVPNVLVSRKWGVYSETPGTYNARTQCRIADTTVNYVGDVFVECRCLILCLKSSILVFHAVPNDVKTIVTEVYFLSHEYTIQL